MKVFKRKNGKEKRKDHQPQQTKSLLGMLAQTHDRDRVSCSVLETTRHLILFGPANPANLKLPVAL